MKAKIKLFLIILLINSIFLVACKDKTDSSKTLNLLVNDKDITSLALPIVESNRTFVALEFVTEELGASLTWINGDEGLLLEKEGNSVKMKRDSRLIEYNNGEKYHLSDIASIISDQDSEGNIRTYLPLRIISDALKIALEWNQEENNIYLDLDKAGGSEFKSNVKIRSHNNGDLIIGETDLQVSINEEYGEDSQIKFLLMDKGETSGFLLAKGSDLRGKYKYTPKIEDNGEKILVAAIYDAKDNFLGGDAIGLKIELQPKIDLIGLEDDQIIRTSADLSTRANFIPLYVKYEMGEVASSYRGDENLTDVKDPQAVFTWNPMMKENGFYSIRAVAYDIMENPYYSDPVFVQVAKERSLSLGGVKENMTIDKSVKLIANRNFDVSETEYLMRDIKTGKIETIAKIPYGGYTWNPGPSDSGIKELFVRVVERGRSYESKPIRVVVDGKAKILIQGIGPGQVVNESVSLNISSNVKTNNIKYIVTNIDKGESREILPKEDSGEAIYSPRENEEGNMTIMAQAEYGGRKISSEKIEFKLYRGEFFGPKAIVEKAAFIPLVSKLALKTYEEIGMSAALQTSQAILESGWGQSIPVDKYTGNLSYNLFGIKGKGTAGSVTSNTWEVYNGVTYRIDADFRAYNDLEESWRDHKDLLLRLDRYKPFTEVMYDYTKGAWALKRAGYATDPNYPIKLINIINKYKLYELDKIEI